MEMKQALPVSAATTVAALLVIVLAGWRGFPTGAAGALVLVAASLLVVAVMVLINAAWATERRLKELATIAGRIAGGEYHLYAAHHDGDAVGRVAFEVNAMAERLRERHLGDASDRVVDQAMGRESPNGLVVVDSAGRIRSLNPAVRVLLPVHDDPVGKRPIDAIAVPELQEVLDETARTRLPSERPATVGVRDLLIRAVPLADGVACMGIVLDITSVRAAERSRRDFVANVSHELRTPITALVGYAESLLDDAATLPPHVVTALEAIDRNARRLHLLTEDVLQLSRIEARSGALPLQSEALGPLVSTVVDRYRPRAEAQGVALTVDVPPDLWASLNADAFDHALGNLVDNAVKYSVRGGSVRVVGQVAGDRVRVDVIDTGVGIEEVHRTRVFERFYRGDPARSRAIPGTGLGLALVKHLCIAMNAEVAFTSASGEGSTFSLTLPR